MLKAPKNDFVDFEGGLPIKCLYFKQEQTESHESHITVAKCGNQYLFFSKWLKVSKNVTERKLKVSQENKHK